MARPSGVLLRNVVITPGVNVSVWERGDGHHFWKTGVNLHYWDWINDPSYAIDHGEMHGLRHLEKELEAVFEAVRLRLDGAREGLVTKHVDGTGVRRTEEQRAAVTEAVRKALRKGEK